MAAQVLLAERTDVHKSCKSLETIVNLFNDYCQALDTLTTAQKKLAKALRDASSLRFPPAHGNGQGDTGTGIAANAMNAVAGVFENLADVDAKFVKVADRECEAVSADLKKWFKKLAKEERNHDEKISAANAKIKQAGQAYEKKAKRKDRDAGDEHARYVHILSTIGPEMSQDKYNHALLVTQRHTSTLYAVISCLARVAESEWARACESVRRFAPAIGHIGELRAYLEGGWTGVVPGGLPDVNVGNGGEGVDGVVSGNGGRGGEGSGETEQESPTTATAGRVPSFPASQLQPPPYLSTPGSQSHSGQQSPQISPASSSANLSTSSTNVATTTTQTNIGGGSGGANANANVNTTHTPLTPPKRPFADQDRSMSVRSIESLSNFPAPPTHFPLPALASPMAHTSHTNNNANANLSGGAGGAGGATRSPSHPHPAVDRGHGAHERQEYFAPGPNAQQDSQYDRSTEANQNQNSGQTQPSAFNNTLPTLTESPRSLHSDIAFSQPTDGNISESAAKHREDTIYAASTTSIATSAATTNDRERRALGLSVAAALAQGVLVNGGNDGKRVEGGEPQRDRMISTGRRTSGGGAWELERTESVKSNGSIVAALRDRWGRSPSQNLNPPTSPTAPPRDVPRLPHSVTDLATRYTPIDDLQQAERSGYRSTIDTSPSPQRRQYTTGTSIDTTALSQSQSSSSPSSSPHTQTSSTTPMNPGNEDAARRRRRLAELEELEIREHEHELREREREIAVRARQLEAERAQLQSARAGLDAYSDEFERAREGLGGTAFADRGGGQSQLQLQQQQNQQNQQRPHPQQYSYSTTNLANTHTRALPSSPSIDRARPQSQYDLQSPPHQQSAPQPPNPNSNSNVNDHAPYCGCHTCSAVHYASTSSAAAGASARELVPPGPPIQLRPEKPKGWMRRLSMPVGNAFSLDSRKSGGVGGGGGVSPISPGGGVGGSLGALGRGSGSRQGLMAPPLENGKLAARRSFEQDATGGISNVAARTRKISFGRR
ncbi:hypothetical protein BD410DRAFT_826407 [Rickenella mellea]|uniref:IMD domain-containing protein n=1 Tax=Rickenella mellea TaxID=50990 RepID=A0A4Y7QDX8_9AGAM|nr:hypothetical protein BD410DRAFT_826407 [Rickenella mellea]